MLLRKYVHELLSCYYKQPHNAVVGAVNSTTSTSTSTTGLLQAQVEAQAQANPINFRSILGKWHWQLIHRHLYRKQTGQWLTPVELFRPFYSRIIGNFVAAEASRVHVGGSSTAFTSMNNHNDGHGKESSSSSSLEIIEIGGGRGTNALCILDHLQLEHPDVYQRLKSYTIMDSSPTLLDLMDNVLVRSEQSKSNNGHIHGNANGSANETYNGQLILESHRHSNKVVLKQIDMMDVAENRLNLEKSKTHTIFIAMEVLDNLAHDKVTLCEMSGAVLQGEIQYPSGKNFKDVHKNELEEVFKPLSDGLLKHVLKTQPSYLPDSPHSNGTKWIPTVACGMIQGFLTSRRNSSVILADFDWLPPPQFESRSIRSRRSLGGEFEPLVTCMDDVDHACYLNSPELCDILFPTYFPALNEYVEKLLQEHKIPSTANFMKQNDFLDRYGKEEVDRTRGMLTGYTPLLEDFSNCSVLTVTRGTK